MLLDALAVLVRRGVGFQAEIAGHGPLAESLRIQAHELGLDDHVRFLGYLAPHTAVEAFLATGSVGVAPYDSRGDSFTRFADPSKLKSYAAAGLPIVTTDVPPNAGDLERSGAATVVEFTPESIADGLAAALADPAAWTAARGAALGYAADFDWLAICDRAFEAVGFTASGASAPR
jgi:glycosyltransferase involved in cell wall biosynthesis